jgi:hypothetical protein
MGVLSRAMSDARLAPTEAALEVNPVAVAVRAMPHSGGRHAHRPAQHRGVGHREEPSW